MHAGEFNQDGKVEFYAVKRKPFDLRRLQSAMFTDRPDLWTIPKKKRVRKIPQGQQELF